MNVARQMMSWFAVLLGTTIVPLATTSLRAETVFVEAETFRPSSPGWIATDNDQTRRASRVKTMWGADGAVDAVATKTVKLTESGTYRVWVRYMQVAAWRSVSSRGCGRREDRRGAGV